MTRLITLMIGLLIVAAFMPATRLFAEPVTAETRLRSGLANLRQENYEEAIEDLEEVRRLVPASSQAAYYLGVAYKKVQNFERAEDNLADAMRLRPAVREAVVELADVFFQTGAIEKTMAQIEVAEREGIRPAETAFLKGLVLIKFRRYNEAVSSFEKAAALDDNLSAAAGYHIGVAKMLLGSLKEAREIFLSSVLRDPNADLAVFATEYIDAISRRLRESRPLRLVAGASLVYDDNVLLKPGDAAAAGSVTDEADTAYALNFRADYTRPLGGGYSIDAQYSMYLIDYTELSSHDVNIHAATVSPTYTWTQAAAAVPVSLAYTLVDGYGYLRTVRVEPSYSLGRGPDTLIRATIAFEANSYLNEPALADEDRDNLELGFSAEWYRIFGRSPRRTGRDAGAATQNFITLRYGFIASDSDGVNWRNCSNTVGAGVAYAATGRLGVNLNAEAAWQDFTETHTVFGSKRKDRTYTLGSTLSYSLGRGVGLLARLTYIRGKSNIAIYDYDKFVVSSGLQVGF